MMDEPWVLQLCHGYAPPFDDVARQWTALFDDKPVKVLTVFLTGANDASVVSRVGGDEVLFWQYQSKDLKGLKLAQISRLRALHQQYQFKFALSHRYKSIYIAGCVPGLQVVGICHAFGVFKRWTRRWFAVSRRRNLMLVGVSNAVRDDIRSSLPWFPQRCIQTLYNRIDFDALKANQIPREEAREQMGLPMGGYLFANVARLHPDKDQKTLLRGFARVADRLADSQLVIVGTGRLEPELKVLANELGIADKVVFMGRLEQAWLYYQAFDSFVLSSDHEPFGMVLLEAMAAGLPVACTDCGGGAEVVGDDQWLFKLNDDRALADCMVRLYALTGESQQQADMRREKSRSRIFEFFSDQAAKQVFWQLPFMQENLPDI